MHHSEPEDSPTVAFLGTKERSGSLDVQSKFDYSRRPSRVIGSLLLSFLAYSAVSAGPFGIEAAVQAAGAFPTIIAILVLPILWGLPQALMTAELSTMMDENGGYIVWVHRGLGDFAGWINSFNSLGSNLTDLPLYPLLLESYIQAFYPGVTPFENWAIKILTLILITGINLFGMKGVGWASVVMTIFIAAPFLVEPFFAIPDIRANFPVWEKSTPTINWGLFVGAILWNYQGWDSLGCYAGEVRRDKKTYPLGISAALVMITITYLLPVAVGVCVVPNFAKWNSDANGGVGYLATIGQSLAPWLGTWIVIAAVIGNVTEMNAVMSSSSRALQCMSRKRQVPAILARGWGPNDVPVVAILGQGVVCSVLMTFLTYDKLVVVDTLFNNVSLVLEFMSFLRLRYTEPGAPRPYVVPGGLPVAWLIAITHFGVLLYAFVLSAPLTWLIVGCFNVLFLLAFPVWRHYNPVFASSERARPLLGTNMWYENSASQEKLRV